MLTLIVAHTIGCSEPEGSDMRDLVGQVSAMSAATKQTLRVALGKKRLYEFLSSRADDDEVMHMECRSRVDGGDWGPWQRHDTYLDPADDPAQHPIRIDYLLDKLKLYDMTADQVYFQEELPIAKHEAFKLAQASGKDVECKPVWEPGYEGLPDISDPDRVTDEDIAKELFKSAAFAAIVFGTGGAGEGALPVLCPLAADWTCPTDPNLPPGQTPQPGDQP
jgi:hypothetical protein